MLKNRMEFLTCYTGVIQDNKLYTVHEGLGLLMEYDLLSFSYKVLTILKVGEKEQRVRVKGMVISNQVIYIILGNSWNIFEYHMESGQILINGDDKKYNDGALLIENCFLYRNEIWLLPCYANEYIRIFDLKTKQYSMRKPIIDELKYYGANVYKKSFLDYAFTNEGIIYAIIYKSEYIVSIDINTGQYFLYCIGGRKKLSSINYDGKNYWLSFFDSTIIEKWSPKNGIIEEYVIDEIDIDDTGQQIRFIYELQGKLYIIPTFVPYIFILNKKNKKISKMNYPKNFKRIHNNSERYQFFRDILYKDKIIVLPFAVNEMLLIDKKNNKVNFIESILSREDIEKYTIKLETGVIEEKYGYGIRQFLEHL